MKLYKYYGENQFSSERAFHNNGLSIRFSSFSEFNDPFEGRLDLSEKIKPFFDYMRSSPDLSKETKKINKHEEEDLERNQRTIIEKIENQFGIYCLTTEPDNKLMWSHYSDSHKGFCIEFDFDSEIPCDYPNKILKVKYQDYRLKYRETLQDLEYLKSILSTKDLIWKYENEYRAVANITKGKIAFIDIKKVKRIIFGLNCYPSNIQKVIKWIDEHKAYHIILSKISLSHNSFDIYIEDLRHTSDTRNP